MNISVKPKRLSGCVNAPQSKSMCHRVLICAALADKPTRLNIKNPPYDVQKTIELLNAIGAEVEIFSDHINVVPISKLPESVVFDCGQSSSTLRFAIPFAASLGIEIQFNGSGNLSVDHIKSLMDALSNHGCTFESEELPIKMTGKIKSGHYIIPASESSQFASSLLMGLARTEGESKITLLPPINSKRYIDQTVSVLSAFGSKIDITDDGYIIHGRPFVAPDEYTPEADYASSAVWLGTGVRVKGLPMRSVQADETVIDVLVSMGALIFENEGELHCDINNLHAFSLDGAQFPDIIAPLCAIAATAKGTTHIMGVGKLRYRDIDRVRGISELINALGGKAHSFDEDIVIEGVSGLSGGVAPCAGDHRLVTAAAIMSCKCKNPVIINDADVIRKSYPNFWEEFQSVGGEYEIL